MSFSSYKEVIEEGDTVILYLNPNRMHAIKVLKTIKNKRGKSVENVFQTTYGALKVSHLIGESFGTKIEFPPGWGYVLHPTPELWTLTLPHRTQIIYTPDISMIIFQLEIKSGSVVLEAGTGSGSLTHALARCVQPNGCVHTFDFHQQRVILAKEEFEEHGISNVVSVKQRDVCKDGFGEELAGAADAIFLDLPHPWLVIPHTLKAFSKSGGRFCSFSPCIEQVQRTCSALRDNNFLDVTTMECLQREIQVNSRTQSVIQLSKESSDEHKQRNFICTSYAPTMTGHTGYLTVATLPPYWTRNREEIDEVMEAEIIVKTEELTETENENKTIKEETPNEAGDAM